MTKLYVQLGRAGDVMNILPLLWDDFRKSGAKSGLMVAKDYVSILDGISYVESVVYDGPHFEIAKAVAIAKSLCKEVVCTQVNGPREQVLEHVYKPAGQTGARATSFQKESWRVAGRLSEWDNLPALVFDKRDAVREEKLLYDTNLIRKGKQKPILILALHSNSSPFPYSSLLRELVWLRFKDEFRVIELPKAERIYDLLALYERASLLIAVDSAPLHLAWACRKLPVFALTQDRGPANLWHGASWRPNHRWHCRYNGWPKRAMEMLAAIHLIDKYEESGPLTVWSEYDRRGSCAIVGNTLPVAVGSCGRDAAFLIKDTKKRAPYLKDVLRMAMQRAVTDNTVINLKRPQVVLNYNFTTPCFAYRMTKSDTGLEYLPIADAFSATRKWWREALPEIPDFLLDSDHLWSEGLRLIFKSRGAVDATGCCEFVKGLL